MGGQGLEQGGLPLEPVGSRCVLGLKAPFPPLRAGVCSFMMEWARVEVAWIPAGTSEPLLCLLFKAVG